MTAHAAVVTTAIKGPLEVHQVPTVPPASGEVLVRVEWTASTPLDLHQNDGGLLVKHPQVMGGGLAGTVVQLGPDVKSLQIGETVFGYGWREQKEKSHQIFSTMPVYLLSKIPEGFTMQQAVTLPNNFVTVFHAVTTDLGISLPWPRPATEPAHADTPILIWGGASSVGMYAIQILHYYGFRKVIATASKKNHQALKELAAAEVFDYRDANVVTAIQAWARQNAGPNRTSPAIPFVLDCIGSKDGSLAPLARIASPGSKVAVLLPVIVRDSSETTVPEYSMDVGTSAAWVKGVQATGVRTHFYLDNAMFKDKLQSEIMPELLSRGVVTPNKQRVIEGATMLGRAQNAMDALRRKEPSGERLVWRVSD